jgi:hypothetical protein
MLEIISASYLLFLLLVPPMGLFNNCFCLAAGSVGNRCYKEPCTAPKSYERDRLPGLIGSVVRL